MKIGMRAVSEVREGEVRRRSVRHDHGIEINVGIDVEVRLESWVASVSGFWLPMQVDSWLWVGSASSFMGLGCQC